MKIAIIDYGAGNLKSVKKAMSYIGVECIVTDNENEIEDSSAIILPGVGAFPDAMNELNRRGLSNIIKEQADKKPLLGICLGMQMLFEKSNEFGECQGLGLISGTVEKLEFKEGMKIPHMGWNSLTFCNNSPLFENCEDGGYVYFVHSYSARTEQNNVTAYTEYSQRVTAAAGKENIFGTQFHPEKSGEFGLKMLKNFCKYANKF